MPVYLHMKQIHFLNNSTMKSNLLLVLGTLLLWAPLVVAQDAETEVRALITQRDQEIKAAVRGMKEDPALQEVARSLINDQIDFEEMGRLSLGRYYEDISVQQRQDFVEVFGEIVRSQSLGDLSVYEAPVTIGTVVVRDNKASVSTVAEIRGTDVEVSYQLHRKGDKWWLYDIIIDGVGTVEGYSVSFQTYVRKRGFDAFMQSLRKRLATTE
ncbi:MAG: ABC transporter substrate-binding protein [Rhodothermaceae bacterium]|nr:ABC transporter substrate-binding protein [Rhodothermaceae bacterium]MXZ57715.1 ABC transporter substrate-binding protein [Rhodothermaceae bacterium]MYB91766.1 ABC transporter substrate-binding protein [Rhodothermaceae bacterium]MYD68991.1 ABC transporter substrate-binding protein [Rhodothermaceae bacterium]MYG45573.1 ABC transporter substrate-binding protein [Rhodothermaceae bacterium]